MSMDSHHQFLPGPRVEAVLPALVHTAASGDFTACPDPAACPQCQPKLAQRRAFYAATGAERTRLQEDLAEAQRLDGAEVRAREELRLASQAAIPHARPGPPF